MESEFVSYTLTLDLKELGFDEPCLAWHNGKMSFIDKYSITNSKFCTDHSCTLPLFQQAFKFFRDKYKLEASIQRMPPEVYGKGKGDIKNYLVYIWAELLNPRGQVTLHFDTYEEAELECIKKLIEIVKNK